MPRGSREIYAVFRARLFGKKWLRGEWAKHEWAKHESEGPRWCTKVCWVKQPLPYYTGMDCAWSL